MGHIKELKTTITGIVVAIAGSMYFALPYFSSKQLWEPNMWIFGGSIVAGIGLILAPDRLINFLFAWAKKKTE